MMLLLKVHPEVMNTLTQNPLARAQEMQERLGIVFTAVQPYVSLKVCSYRRVEWLSKGQLSVFATVHCLSPP